MARMKKFVAAAAVTAAVVGVPTMAHALTTPAKAASAKAPAAAIARARVITASARTVRVVAPGERVQAAPGVQLWLTRDGMHWSTPEKADQFRSVTDGNLGRQGISVQTDGAKGRSFLFGVYVGKGTPATVKVVTSQGTFTGTVVHLAGQPGWGAWYLPKELRLAPGRTIAMHNGLRSVTVTDTAGHTIAALTVH